MSNFANYIKEACVESLEQAIAAEKNGAHRIELCAHLEQDGLTPSKQLIRKVKSQVNIPVRVMIRPGAGNFIYSEAELEEMKASIEFCKNVGVEGVVFGILNEDKTLNLKAISRLAKIAKPLKVAIHKAIDETPDILKAVEELSNIEEVNTVLTSGGKNTAAQGIPVLKQMLKIAKNRLEIMPAGNITIENIENIHRGLGAKAYHGKLIVGELEP
ncbi:copper homeostasis protein CutC [Zunongwangia sp. F363]|uniref:PF03932 family protein CutC n=1 Tax=Autumnicola tepida TaxID=3075595 RepID=A0ABU3C4N6_9FLAO|nr:copper homeostasis protein CutC [Zunongwangia sp. F363]MDT0641297.1 copper homeostasis protein CutC [Zunongwangia sp. F363]